VKSPSFGSLAHADPAAEIPAVLVTLDGEVVVFGVGGASTIQADDFFVSYYTAALTESELLTAVRLPARPAAAATELLERPDPPSGAEIREVLSGNICRCTGYETIVDAVSAVAAARLGGER
jgi:xanthine dehydrogenase iron-sulfur cluster and FAD-binding subunit A